VAKKASEKHAAGARKPSFEESLEQLEAIVRRLEDGQLPLAESLDQYEQGVRHLKACYTLLEQAERRIELLSGTDDQGAPVTEPFDDSATCGSQEEGTSGVRRRVKARRERPDRDDRGSAEQLF
jgi:exodeoxyribonuclease VII small subunit